MSKILPIKIPPITSYPAVANTMSILWAHQKTAMPWICDHFIQLIVRPDDFSTDWGNFYDFIFTNGVMPSENCAYLFNQYLDKKTGIVPKNGFVDFIKMQIDHNYYIETWLDQSQFTPNADPSSPLYHPTFIFGYDDEKQTVETADFYSFGKYREKSVSFDGINRSYDSIEVHEDHPGWYFGMCMYQFVDFDYQLKKSLLKQSLQDYINCTDSTGKYDHAYDTSGQVYFGLDYYDQMVIHSSLCFRHKIKIDIRPFCVLYDHKLVLRMRFDYLREQKLLLPESLELLDGEIDALIDETMSLRNAVLKFNLVPNEIKLESLQNLCQSAKALDRKVSGDLLKSIL